MLRVALQLGVRASQRDLVFEDIIDDEDALKNLLASYHEMNAMACSMDTLAFILLRLDHAGLMGVRRHELGGRFLPKASDRGSLNQDRRAMSVRKKSALDCVTRPANFCGCRPKGSCRPSMQDVAAQD